MHTSVRTGGLSILPTGCEIKPISALKRQDTVQPDSSRDRQCGRIRCRHELLGSGCCVSYRKADPFSPIHRYSENLTEMCASERLGQVHRRHYASSAARWLRSPRHAGKYEGAACDEGTSIPLTNVTLTKGSWPWLHVDGPVR